jgi:hypothetical protein
MEVTYFIKLIGKITTDFDRSPKPSRNIKRLPMSTIQQFLQLSDEKYVGFATDLLRMRNAVAANAEHQELIEGNIDSLGKQLMDLYWKNLSSVTPEAHALCVRLDERLQHIRTAMSRLTDYMEETNKTISEMLQIKDNIASEDEAGRDAELDMQYLMTLKKRGLNCVRTSQFTGVFQEKTHELRLVVDSEGVSAIVSDENLTDEVKDFMKQHNIQLHP